MSAQYRNQLFDGCCNLLQIARIRPESAANRPIEAVYHSPGRDGVGADTGASMPSRRRLPMLKLLVVTNDFPPRVGGIEQYVAELVRHLSAGVSTTVLTSRHPEAERIDPMFPARVIRWARYPLLPSPALASAVAD